MSIFFLFIISSLLYGTCMSHRGLFVMPTGSRSHMGYFQTIIEALIQHNHEITFVSPYKIDLQSSRLTTLNVKDTREKSVGNPFDLSFIKFLDYIKYVPNQCVNTLMNPDVQRILEESFDYVILPILYGECFLGYVYHKKIPLINIYPNILENYFLQRIGLPEFWSVYPPKLASYTYPLTFWQRVTSTVINIGWHYTTWLLDARTEQKCREHNLWLSDMPSIGELQKQGSLTIINSIRALEVPVQSTLPTVVYAGGIHIKSTERIPKDIEEWLNGSGEAGFILFSLGTAVKSEQMKKHHVQTIVKVFRSLDQRILWKWDAQDIEDLPPNVKLSPWLPQQSVLRYPKIRLFITHGGLFSVQEATYFSVPILGMPVFSDQMSNVAQVVQEGWGLQLTWDELSEDTFQRLIKQALTNDSLRETVTKKSQLIRDWPTKPDEEVVYWIEYVIRHKGAKHLQSPFTHMHWITIYNIDVWLFIFSVLLIITVPCLYFTNVCLQFFIMKYMNKIFKRKKTE